ncbi:MAG: DUF2971 domain-containing protein [Pseudomonadota bacterium]
MTDSDSIYYYTSLENGYNNLISETLYFSDITELNDTAEVSYISDELQKVVGNYAVDDNYVRSKVIWIIEKLVIPTVNIMFKLKKLESYRKEESYPYLKSLAETLGDSKAYVFCCSKKKDDLSMWKFYGGNVGGVVIEFDRKVIEKSFNKKNDESNDKNKENDKNDEVSIDDVKYCEETLECNLINLVDNLVQNISQVDWQESDKLNQELEPVIKTFWDFLMEEVIFSKNKNWQHEEEIRIFHKGVDEFLEDSIINGRKRSFLKLKFKLESIKGIKLGPLSTQEQMEYFEELIKEKNLQIKLEKSAIGYRG